MISPDAQFFAIFYLVIGIISVGRLWMVNDFPFEDSRVLFFWKLIFIIISLACAVMCSFATWYWLSGVY